MDDTYRFPVTASMPADRAGLARVLIVTPVGLEGRGGIDRLNLYLHGYLLQRGDASHLTFIGSRGELPGPAWGMTFVSAMFQFVFHCLSGKHDIVHIHVSTSGSALRKVAFALLAWLMRMPYVIQFHGMMCAEYEQARPLWYRALALSARGAQQVIALGEAYRPTFERMGVNPTRICVIYNGIPDIGDNAVIPRPEQESVRILFSGEVGERKGALLLIEALAQLANSNTRWTCTIAGNGDLTVPKQAVLDAGIADRVNFTGWIGIDEIHNLMRECDIVVLPSRAEALPLALIEGASAGAALISCDIGAVRDVVVDGVNGLIVKRNSDDIAVALERLLSDPGLRQGMQLASRQIYRERFQVSHFASSILGTYAAILRH